MFRAKSRIESRLREFPFLWVLQPENGWGSKHDVLVKTIDNDTLGYSMNPDTKWWIYAKRQYCGETYCRVVPVPWMVGSLADAVSSACPAEFGVANLISHKSGSLWHDAYIVWRIKR